MTTDYLKLLNQLKVKSPIEKAKEQAAEKEAGESVFVRKYNKDMCNKSKENAGYDIRIRFLPDFSMESIDLFEHHHHKWQSPVTKEILDVECLRKNCPACHTSYTWWTGTDEALKKKSEGFRRKVDHNANVYVIKNEAYPNENGKVKVLELTKELKDIYDRVVTGRESKVIGKRVYDLTTEGCTFVIHVKAKSPQFPTYVDSFAEYPDDCADDVKDLTNEDINRIYGEAKDLSKMYTPISKEEMQDLLNRDFINFVTPTEDEESEEYESDIDTTETKSIVKEEPKNEVKTEVSKRVRVEEKVDPEESAPVENVKRPTETVKPSTPVETTGRVEKKTVKSGVDNLDALLSELS